MSVELLILRPIAAEAIKSGFAFLQKITDDLAIAAFGGNLVLLGTTGKPMPMGARLTLVFPIYLSNRSKLEHCILRGLTSSLTAIGGPGDPMTPFDASFDLVATGLAESIDAVVHENELAAAVAREDTPERREALAAHQRESRTIFESVLIGPGETTKLNVLFQHELRTGAPAKLSGDFRVSIFGDLAFSSVVVDGSSELFSSRIRTDIELVENVAVLREICSLKRV